MKIGEENWKIITRTGNQMRLGENIKVTKTGISIGSEITKRFFSQDRVFVTLHYNPRLKEVKMTLVNEPTLNRFIVKHFKGSRASHLQWTKCLFIKGRYLADVLDGELHIFNIEEVKKDG